MRALRGQARRAPTVLMTVLEAVLVAAAYYLSARLALRLALIEKNVTPLWPPTGIAVVGFLLLGRRIWPGIALAAFLVNVPITPTPWVALATAAGNTLAPFVAAELLRLVGFRREIDRLRDAIAIVLLASLLAMLISATIGAAALRLSHGIRSDDFAAAWAVWWTGDAMGVLVVAPFLLSLLLFRPRVPTSWARRVEAVALFVALTALTLAVARNHHPILFVVLPLLGWAAWRFQQRGAAPAALLVAGIVTWAADHDWGPFAHTTLFAKMLTLQAFNATVAFASFVFAALVMERIRAREALETAAAELEERVRRRTAELSTANRWLTREITDRRDAEHRLHLRERQLAEAQQLAHIGSWDWLIDDDRVTWSDEMYRIYGHEPQQFPVTFERAVEQVLPEDQGRIQGNVAEALRSTADRALPATEFRIRRPDGRERVLLAKSKLLVGRDGRPQRMVGTVQDVTEDKQAEREHRIAVTLQRSLLPERVPEIPGVLLAARYVPATADAEVGGDWYDVVPLPDGRVGVGIGDVAGHGLRAASAMGQLRMALRAYAVEESSPAAVVGRLRQLVALLAHTEMATLLYLVFDPETVSVTFANAGHPPPLLIGDDGSAAFLESVPAPPLGTVAHADAYVDATSPLPPGGTLLLFTDGLIERRGVSLRRGMARLKRHAVQARGDLDGLCDHLLATFDADEASDDIALLALRPLPIAAGSVHVRVPADPKALAPLRRTIRRWLREIHAEAQDGYEILVACGEACANAIQHPYGATEGILDVLLARADGEVEVVVSDSGTWRRASPPGGGHGLLLMRAFMDSVEVDTGVAGTVVRMRKRLADGGSA